MHAEKVSHKILKNTCAWMHTTRRKALEENVLAAIRERRLSVTGLGRAINSEAREKHCIKRADRLIGNPHLYREYRDVYLSFTRIILGSIKRPVILIDWSDLDPRKEYFLLRAAVAVDGRSLSLYEEVHGLDAKERPDVHRRFLHRLKSLLPDTCRPILVTDAGFRTPWFTLVAQMGWDWVGRLRNRHLVRVSEQDKWFRSNEFYALATATPKHLGRMQLTRRGPISCHFVLHKGKPKGRSKWTTAGERACSAQSEKCAQREREPWLLVTSLPATAKLAKRVVNIYKTRMQVEEAFRDVKSVRFGIGFELNLSRSAERIQILLLVAMIATFVLWLLGMAARFTGQHLQYQANSIRRRNVLSVIYLGLRIARDRRFQFDLDVLPCVANSLHETIRRHGEGW
jgi:hypothetical protein